MKKKLNKKKDNSISKKGGNGKGDSPRNMSLKFKKNYDKINWKNR
tara:strand:- start:815 stop:949 length:135 start_codon:yes stop_codon:yes gene_type:complete